MIPISRQYWSETLATAVAAGTAVTQSTETIVFNNITIPANYMQDSRALRGRMFGQIGNVVTAVPTVTFRIRWGGVAGTVLAATAAIGLSATAFTAAIWDWEFIIQTRSNGSSGTLMTIGSINLPNDATPQARPMGSAGAATPAVATVDLTADTALSVTAIWSATNAANTLTGHIYTLEALN